MSNSLDEQAYLCHSKFSGFHFFDLATTSVINFFVFQSKHSVTRKPRMYGLEESVIRGLIVLALFRGGDSPMDQTNTPCGASWSIQVSVHLVHILVVFLSSTFTIVHVTTSNFHTRWYLHFGLNHVAATCLNVYQSPIQWTLIFWVFLCYYYPVYTDKLVNFKLGLCYKNLALCLLIQHLGSNVQ